MNKLLARLRAFQPFLQIKNARLADTTVEATDKRTTFLVTVAKIFGYCAFDKTNRRASSYNTFLDYVVILKLFLIFLCITLTLCTLTPGAL